MALQNKHAPWCAIVIIATACVVAVCSLEVWRARADRSIQHAVRILLLSERIQTRISEVHLWFEEELAQDPSVDHQRDVLEPLGMLHNQILRELPFQESSHLFRDAADSARNLQDLDKKIAQFERAIDWRRASGQEGLTGSELDQHFDDIFRDILGLCERISRISEARMANASASISTVNTGMIALTASLLIGLIIATLRPAPSRAVHSPARWQTPTSGLASVRRGASRDARKHTRLVPSRSTGERHGANSFAGALFVHLATLLKAARLLPASPALQGKSSPTCESCRDLQQFLHNPHPGANCKTSPCPYDGARVPPRAAEPDQLAHPDRMATATDPAPSLASAASTPCSPSRASVPSGHSPESDTDAPPLESPPLSRQGESGSPASTRAAPRPVLVVEDHEINQRLILALLERLGYSAELVANGRHAVEAARSGQYCAILMDCQMPGTDGYEATALIRQSEPSGSHIPIIAVTAHAQSTDRKRALEAGMDDYLTKPVLLDRLAGVLRKWVSTKPPGQPPLVVTPPVRLDALFLRHAPAHLTALQRACRSKRARLLGETAHRLRGSALSAGFEDIAHTCARLEDMARRDQLAGVATIIEEIEHQLSNLRAPRDTTTRTAP